MRRLTVNIGFITNSSSVIHWFDGAILKDPEVQAFIDAYELSAGSIGENLWNRARCGSLLTTEDQFAQVREDLADEIGSNNIVQNGGVATRNGGVAIIYGDEYATIFSELAHVMSEAAERLNISNWSNSYN